MGRTVRSAAHRYRGQSGVVWSGVLRCGEFGFRKGNSHMPSEEGGTGRGGVNSPWLVALAYRKGGGFFFGGEMLHADTFATHQWHCLPGLHRLKP
jgi:hypothetical protein